MKTSKLEVCPYVLTSTELIVNVRHKEDQRIVYSERSAYLQTISTEDFHSLILDTMKRAEQWILKREGSR